ncbi:alpha/beta-hydrolase [Laetiporus sulphureus 93-53]|uniref:Alpha/beta-hydrolase n=1 Tax=Laetiporus sulphureus 93-53 TaxID=1314785 RepID=A0A165CNW2_9APHY|nr:alpha/beta-hydrolase [Laetiporus sulphureus 93-53]KZT03149.1 alpha/beta-hydrolase [Laetiporus sulphureus 93-53]
MFAFRHEPLKSLYKLYAYVATICVRLPYANITSRIQALRPRRTWSARRAYILPLLRARIEDWFATGLPLSPGHDPEEIVASGQADALGFVWVPAIDPGLIVGEVSEMAELNGVKPKKTHGYWLKSQKVTGKGDYKADEGEKVVMYFHGGGYVMSSSHPNGGPTGPICSGILGNCTTVTRIFSCGYRLSSSYPYPAANPFPAALLDALAGYQYLLRTIGVRGENIIILGDSAGGHLAVSLVRYLATHNLNELPTPGALVLLSPTVEFEITHKGSGSSLNRNAATDYCGIFFKGYPGKSLLGNFPEKEALTNAWISPASLQLSRFEGLFTGFPSTYIVCGEAEIGLDAMRTFRDRLIGDIGETKVTYDEVKDATHDFITMSWHEPERSNILKIIGEWIDAR